VWSAGRRAALEAAELVQRGFLFRGRWNMTKPKPTTSDGPEIVIARSKRTSRLEAIEQALNRIDDFLAASDGTEIVIARSERGPRIEDIEQTETSLWVEQQLNRIHDFLVERDADSEMLDAVDYLIEDNEQWMDEKIEKDLRAGNLQSGQA
jgi:hypothetical protein